jgi:hypothetical protein
LKSCAIEPLFATLNTTVPRGTTFFESVNPKIPGLPAVTATVVVADCCANADTAATSETTATSASTTNPIRKLRTTPPRWTPPTH